MNLASLSASFHDTNIDFHAPLLKALNKVYSRLLQFLTFSKSKNDYTKYIYSDRKTYANFHDYKYHYTYKQYICLLFIFQALAR